MISGRQQPARSAASVKRSLGKSILARVSSPSSSARRGMHSPSPETATRAAACLKWHIKTQTGAKTAHSKKKKKRLVMISFTKACSASVIIWVPGASGWGWTSLALPCLAPPVFITYVWIFIPHYVSPPGLFLFFLPRTQSLPGM